MNYATERNTYSAVNTCRLCSPLGASLAFKGIEKAIPLIHGSQGCATYIRRYIISHFREPVDIASSNFDETTAIFGGEDNFFRAIANITAQYSPSVIGIATTCLSETIGDDIRFWIRKYNLELRPESAPLLIHVSTPAYKGTHEDGFHATVASIVKTCSDTSHTGSDLMVLPPMISPDDMRNLSTICHDFGLATNLLPDYSDTLNGGIWKEYQLIPSGGTPLLVIQGIGSSRAVVELGAGSALREAGKYISETFSSPVTRMNLPVGVNATDNFLGYLSTLSGKEIPDPYTNAREQLIDAYVDGHKYVFEKKAVISGDEDTIAAVVALCTEIGITPVILASSSGTQRLKLSIADLLNEKSIDITIIDEADMDTIELMCKDNKPDLFIGTSKCYPLSRKLGIPLVRVGFPVHDRFGAARITMTGYSGTIRLFDKIVNALLEHKQENNDIGYSYL